MAHASPFAESGVDTYVRDKKLELAGLRGSRSAQLIKRLGAWNQVADDVRHLPHAGMDLGRRGSGTGLRVIP